MMQNMIKVAVAMLLLATTSVAIKTSIVHKVKVGGPSPGSPIMMRFAIDLDPIAQSVNLVPSYTKVISGNFTSPLPASIANSASHAFNYGAAIAPAENMLVNATFLYRDDATGIFLEIAMFSVPGEFGLEVESSEKVCTATIFDSLYGDGPTTEADYVIHISSPQSGNPPVTDKRLRKEESQVEDIFAAEPTKNRTLACGTIATRFTAILDPSNYLPGSGYFDVRNAMIMDNYNMGQLTCIGSSLRREINCVGFNNGAGDQVFYVTIPPGANNVSYTMLKGMPGPTANKPWPCTLS
eukprot:m.332463 g.332463  ORF g.332463 m.332463 type:complete len:296 (+) comp16949_c0_seq1:128-1015(+)